MLTIFIELVGSSKISFLLMNLHRKLVFWREIREKIADFSVTERI